MNTDLHRLVASCVVMAICQFASYGDIIIESASTNFSTGGAGIGFRGTRFYLSGPTLITGAETVIITSDESTPTGAEPRRYDILSLLVPLDPETGMPYLLFQDENDLTLGLAQSSVTYWTPGTGVSEQNVELEFAYDTILPAGDYAVIFSGYTYGYNAGGMPSSSPLVFGHNIYLAGDHWSTLADDFRFVVEGTIIPEPHAAALFLLALSMLGIRACKHARIAKLSNHGLEATGNPLRGSPSPQP